MSDHPVTDAELSGIFAPLKPYAHWGLAVSGGSDSMALMHLAARYLTGNRGTRASVLTVDHGLRAESAAEAGFVAEAAAGLGLAHMTLRWEGAKPSSGVQAAAREARYDLMADHALAQGIDCLVTAHHLEDQAETVLMRLKRGSGPDGLAGIPEVGRWGGLPICRPLLSLSSERLRAALDAAGVGWIEDPSNDDERYERVRVRKAMAELERLGYTAEGLAKAARRMRRASEALDATTQGFLVANASVSAAGYCAIERSAFAEAPEEIALRALRRAIEAVRGGVAEVNLAKLEALTATLRGAERAAATLGGCRIIPQASQIVVLREPGRKGLDSFGLAPGEARLWDRRFHVCVPDTAREPVTVRALGASGARQLRARAGDSVKLPAAAAEAVVSIWSGDELVAVPPLGFNAAQTRYAARFVNAELFRDTRC